ncbi:hypothetical protein [Acanthopleuribacter pedis]|uniref:Uncharacterized protein n=1 Tax=Acanthopleuribacter pedis TaxID=442870 RepID=A0A8J7QBP8_9BACT|nr:hypothetical protein [Acanthopleuribacter pedis]MBO1318011.1 hypothetical protein [Acanthopleuribacter pedis]
MKTFKIMSLLFVLSSVFSAFAGSGKAIVPMWYSHTSQVTALYISNIAGNDVDVTVTFYKKDGTVATSTITQNNWINSNLSIAANTTANIIITSTTEEYGYAVIEWVNRGSDDDTIALVAHGFWGKALSTKESGYAIPVNDGKPF